MKDPNHDYLLLANLGIAAKAIQLASDRDWDVKYELRPAEDAVKKSIRRVEKRIRSQV